jgi:hypothetical protein
MVGKDEQQHAKQLVEGGKHFSLIPAYLTFLKPTFSEKSYQDGFWRMIKTFSPSIKKMKNPIGKSTKVQKHHWKKPRW